MDFYSIPLPHKSLSRLRVSHGYSRRAAMKLNFAPTPVPESRDYSFRRKLVAQSVASKTVARWREAAHSAHGESTLIAATPNIRDKFNFSTRRTTEHSALMRRLKTAFDPRNLQPRMLRRGNLMAERCRYIINTRSRRLRLRSAVRLRSLRTLRRGLPDLRRDTMRDGFPARANLSHEVARRRSHRTRRRCGPPSRFVPRLPRMRDGLSVRSSLRTLDRRRARIRRAKSSSRLGRAIKRAAVGAIFPYPRLSRCSRHLRSSTRGTPPGSTEPSCAQARCATGWICFHRFRPDSASAAPRNQLQRRAPDAPSVVVHQGCVAQVLANSENLNSERLLAAAGYRVIQLESTACCGALDLHRKRRARPRIRARKCSRAQNSGRRRDHVWLRRAARSRSPNTPSCSKHDPSSPRMRASFPPKFEN